MEVSELHDVIKQRFEDLNTNLTSCFKNIDDKNIVTDKAIEDLSQKVTSHDRWLWLLRGMGVIIVALLGLIGVKIRF